ncbi:MAG: MGMT family protein [Gammaproteobacteria bacterium]
MKNEERIWQAVHSIPPGRVATYGQVARLAGLPGYARYVGTVLKNLPRGSRLPWHRVVNARGCLSFPSHSSKHQQQQQLLEAEGILFIDGRLSLSQYGVDQSDA